MFNLCHLWHIYKFNLSVTVLFPVYTNYKVCKNCYKSYVVVKIKSSSAFRKRKSEEILCLLMKIIYPCLGCNRPTKSLELKLFRDIRRLVQMDGKSFNFKLAITYESKSSNVSCIC